LSGKQLSKKNYKVAINMLMNVINEMKEKQNDLEINSNVVINQNKDILLQNEFLLKEIKSKM